MDFKRYNRKIKKLLTKKRSQLLTLIHSVTWKIFWIFFPPIILIWPIFNGFIPYPFKLYYELKSLDQPIKMADLPEKEKMNIMQGESESISGIDIFSSIFKIETEKMPIELCLFNKNVIMDGNHVVDPNSLIDKEAGAMSIKYKSINTNIDYEVYARPRNSDCKTLPSEGIISTNELEFRKPIPINAEAALIEGKVVVNFAYKDLKLNVYSMPAYYRIQWKTSIFLKNYLLGLFAWLIVLSSYITIRNDLFNSSKTDSE